MKGRNNNFVDLDESRVIHPAKEAKNILFVMLGLICELINHSCWHLKALGSTLNINLAICDHFIALPYLIRVLLRTQSYSFSRMPTATLSAYLLPAIFSKVLMEVQSDFRIKTSLSLQSLNFPLNAFTVNFNQFICHILFERSHKCVPVNFVSTSSLHVLIYMLH